MKFDECNSDVIHNVLQLLNPNNVSTVRQLSTRMNEEVEKATTLRESTMLTVIIREKKMKVFEFCEVSGMHQKCTWIDIFHFDSRLKRKKIDVLTIKKTKLDKEYCHTLTQYFQFTQAKIIKFNVYSCTVFSANGPFPDLLAASGALYFTIGKVSCLPHLAKRILQVLPNAHYVQFNLWWGLFSGIKGWQTHVADPWPNKPEPIGFTRYCNLMIPYTLVDEAFAFTFYLSSDDDIIMDKIKSFRQLGKPGLSRAGRLYLHHVKKFHANGVPCDECREREAKLPQAMLNDIKIYVSTLNTVSEQ